MITADDKHDFNFHATMINSNIQVGTNIHKLLGTVFYIAVK